MNSSLTEDYLHWLMSQIRVEHGGQTSKGYEGVCYLMFEKKFEELVPNDSNRMADGCDLRIEFCHSQNLPKEALDLGEASFLEVLIALSRRLSFQQGGQAEDWAWTLIQNLDLHKKSDPVGPRKVQKINDILDRCIRREYSPDGTGGFFPLAWPEEDQTKVEIWYQMAAYLSELPEL